MKKIVTLLLAVFWTLVLYSQSGNPNDIPFKMEEITSPKFSKAVEKAGGVCVIPLGIIEKHGPHLPLGTDLFEARELSFSAAKKEYAIIFPPYFAGQIFEGKHQPGTIAYSTDIMWQMLDETCQELSRNGLKKIILNNGHGGSTNFLEYFCQAQLESRRDYVVVLFQDRSNPAYRKEIESLKKAKTDGHAGEEETSMMYYLRPDLVDIQAINSESGLNQRRLEKLPYGYTGIWWYAEYPNHYASDVAPYNKRLGELLFQSSADQLAELIKFLKTDDSIRQLQDEFYKRSENPLQK